MGMADHGNQRLAKPRQQGWRVCGCSVACLLLRSSAGEQESGGKCLEAGDMLAMLRDHKGRVKWELKHKSRTTPPFQSKQAVRGTADSRQRGSWHALVCSRRRVGAGACLHPCAVRGRKSKKNKRRPQM